MTNRIGGDFNSDAIEAFRNAYAQQLNAPDEDTVANNSGMPTNTIANTSPWYDHVGLWKYPSGKGPDQDLKTPFNPNAYLSDEVVDGDGQIEELSEEDIQKVVDEAAEYDNG
jgi:hypothetical protein